jgi:S-adenosylmethionine hydrolase
MKVITLLSDFGLKDPYVAEMKGVILSINPHTRIVDVTHKIEKFNVRMGAFILASAASYFPTGTVHVAVVDPGVGTKRRPIIVETNRGLFVGPDNGLLMLAAQHEGIMKVNHINNPKYMLSKVSKTFHGRDIFAPTAAHLAAGTNPAMFGPVIKDYVFPEFVKPQINKSRVNGEVLHVDGFGNVISNISARDLETAEIQKGNSLSVEIGCKSFTTKLCSTYSEVPSGTALALIGGTNLLEVAVNQGNASSIFKVKVEDIFHISVEKSG